jgi:hypothetical protein
MVNLGSLVDGFYRTARGVLALLYSVVDSVRLLDLPPWLGRELIWGIEQLFRKGVDNFKRAPAREIAVFVAGQIELEVVAEQDMVSSVSCREVCMSHVALVAHLHTMYRASTLCHWVEFPNAEVTAE